MGSEMCIRDRTTTATALSYLLSKEGCKVALIDFDGQRHTTKLCGVTAPEQLSVTIYDILKCIVMNEELPDKGSYMIRTETGVDLIVTTGSTHSIFLKPSTIAFI